MATNDTAELYFADAQVTALEKNKTLPAKFGRMLKRFKLADKLAGKNVAIKMHLGSDLGYTTISPVFVRILVDAVKEAGAKSVKIMDGCDPERGVGRGYTEEVLGCLIVNAFGADGKDLRPEKIGYKELDEVFLAGEAVDTDFFIDFSHVKGHGSCGFGGSLKNIAMGLTPPQSRSRLHQLEGGLTLDPEKCIYCMKCFNNCNNNAIHKNDEKKEISFFFHNCTFCQHCVLVCPEDAISIENRTFDDFASGMALVTAKFLEKFSRDNLLFINVLTNITIYCDCWEFSTPSLVPDIGIVAGTDLAAVDTASLDMIKTENLLSNGLPVGRELVDVEGHLFEKIHAKDPYLMISLLQKYYECTTKYKLTEVK